MVCILYVNAIGWLLGIAGTLVERVMPAGWSRRWVWCVVILMSLFLPGYYRSHHATTVGDLGNATSTVPLDAGFWARIDAMDPTINRFWFVASAVLILWTLANAGWVSHAVQASRANKRGRGGPAVVDGVPVVVTESLGPATVGLWRTSVLLPKWVLALPGAQRQYVVRHEEEHRRAHDGRLVFFASLLVIVAPWNLALWWQLRRLRLAVEMDCDDRVVRALGDAPAYGNLLLKIAQAANRGPRLQPALLGGAGMLEQRLRLLMARAHMRLGHRVLITAAIGALLLVVLSMPHPVIGSHTHVATTTHAAHAP
ncbi:MAG: M56 family metallopeptidase [bacterium]